MISLDFEALSKGLAGHDCKSRSSLLKCEGEDGCKDKRPSETVTIFCSRPSAGHHCARSHRAGRQHRPVEQRPHLRDDLVVKHDVVDGGGQVSFPRRRSVETKQLVAGWELVAA